MHRSCCLTCGNVNLHEIVDLGSHPFADTFIPKSEQYEPDEVFPLVLDLCDHCHQIQTRTITSPVKRYERYSYTSSNSNVAKRHWDSYARSVSNLVPPKSSVLEIGCNDGYLLSEFQKLGFDCLGVDASQYMIDLANTTGLRATCGIFNKNFSNTLGRFDLVIANNVFNHSNDPLDFLEGVKQVLSPDGLFVFELPYWNIGFKDFKFDQIYHEHVSYFTSHYVVSLLERVGMFVNHIELVDYHGGSIRVSASSKQAPSEIQHFLDDEQRSGVLDPACYKSWIEAIRTRRNRFLQKIYQISNPLVGIGAAAKGNTLLNYYNLDSSVIQFVTDSSPHKIGKFTPRTRIPIVSDDEIKTISGSPVAVILSWNISSMLKDILLKIRPDISFLEL